MMTVRKLIEELSKLDPNLQVRVPFNTCSSHVGEMKIEVATCSDSDIVVIKSIDAEDDY